MTSPVLLISTVRSINTTRNNTAKATSDTLTSMDRKKKSALKKALVYLFFIVLIIRGFIDLCCYLGNLLKLPSLSE